MKTSNILFTTAILFFLSYLAIFDFGLKSQYNSIKKMGLANYEKAHRFDEYQQVQVGSVENIDLNVSNVFNVKVEYGQKEAVWVFKNVTDAIQIDNKANQLVINLKKTWDGNQFNVPEFAVVIITPKLHKLTTFQVLGKDAFEYHRNEVSGFTQDSMFISLADSTKVNMTNNKIGGLEAKVGDGVNGGDFYVADNNKIKSMKIFAQGKSTVQLFNSDITYLEKHLSDSAIVTLKGKVLKGISNEVK